MDCSLVGWCSLPLEAQAAWVQAVFSIVAIGVAIAIPAVQHYRDRKAKHADEIKQARALALMLIPILNFWIDNLRSGIQSIRRQIDGNVPAAIDWRMVRNSLQLGKQSQKLAPLSHQMGPMAKDAQQFFYLLAKTQERVRGLENLRFNAETQRGHGQQIVEMLEATQAAASRALAAAHSLFEAH